MQTQVVFFLKADSKLHAKSLMTLMTLTLMTKMTYYQLNTYKHPPNTHFANVKYLYHKQTFKNWCSPVIKVKVIKVIKGFGGNGIYI